MERDLLFKHLKVRLQSIIYLLRSKNVTPMPFVWKSKKV